MAEFVNEAFPTQGGVYTAYRPEYQSGNTDLSADGWRPVPVVASPCGVPGCGLVGINDTIDMFSFAQASAIAWSHAAAIEAKTFKRPEIRIVPYSVRYDIKCFRAVDVVTLAQEPKP
jgi:hypothetical protein